MYNHNVRRCSTLAGWDPADFKPKTAVVLTKVSRYEFEKLQNEQLTEMQLEEELTKVRLLCTNHEQYCLVEIFGLYLLGEHLLTIGSLYVSVKTFICRVLEDIRPFLISGNWPVFRFHLHEE